MRVKLKNPVMTASGTFGSGRGILGVSGSEPPGGSRHQGSRLRAVGRERYAQDLRDAVRHAERDRPAESRGLEVFAKRDLAFLSRFDTRVVVNVCGHSPEEYTDCVEKLAGESRPDLLEINISCPNVKEGGIAFGTDPKSVERITAAVKRSRRSRSS